MPGRSAKIPLIALLALAACGAEQRALRAVRIVPAPAEGTDVALIALNQEVTVYFSERVDPITVHEDSFRVIGPEGPVRGEFVVGTRSVTFRPIPPVTPALDDGSFRPGASYRLELPGFPNSTTIRSTAGAYLDETVAISLRVPVGPAHAGLPTPFLPVGVGTENLMLDVGAGRPLLAAASGIVRLHFTLPLLPSSVRSEAFQFRRLDGSSRPEPLIPRDLRVLPERVAGTRHYGSTIEIRFAEDVSFAADDVVYVILVEGESALRDYQGRSIVPLPWEEGDPEERPIQIYVDPDVRGVDFGALHQDPEAPLGFEWRNGRIVPRCRVEAGSGRHGWFRPTRSVTIRPGAEFDRGDGVLVRAVPTLEFFGIEIPEGVDVTIDGPISLTASGPIEIDGRLLLRGPLSEVPWKRGESPSPSQLLRTSMVKLVAGGDVVVRGAVEHEDREGLGSPVMFVSAGDILVAGRVPAQSVFAVEPDRRVRGTVESPIQFTVSLTPGLPAGASLRAAAWTDWIRLPGVRSQQLEVFELDRSGDLSAALQIARPHSVDPDRPEDDPRALRKPTPLPLTEAVEVAPGSFARIRLEAVVDGGELPAVGGFTVHRR